MGPVDAYAPNAQLALPRPFGIPVGPYDGGIVRAKLGELVTLAPSNPITVLLPPARRADAGAMVAVWNVTTSSVQVMIEATGGDTATMLGSPFDATGAYSLTYWVVLGEGRWAGF